MEEKTTILVVDDVAMHRTMLSLILRDKYDIVEASNGQDAAWMLELHKDKIALILLDIMMPVADGFSFLEELQEDQREIPVIFVTAEAYLDNVIEGIRLGVKDIIVKPFEPQVVLRRVDNLIQLTQNRAKQAQQTEEGQTPPDETAPLSPPDAALIVDDVGINRTILAGALEDGYRILEAADGAQALEVWEAHRDEIAVVLLDLIMPVMDGTQVLKQAKRSGLLGKIPVLAVTAEESQLKRSGILDFGACEVIGKPFTPYVVRERVDYMVELAWGRPVVPTEPEE